MNNLGNISTPGVYDNDTLEGGGFNFLVTTCNILPLPPETETQDKKYRTVRTDSPRFTILALKMWVSLPS